MQQPLAKKTSAVCYNYKSLSVRDITETEISPQKRKLAIDDGVAHNTNYNIIGSSDALILDKYDYCLVLPISKGAKIKLSDESERLLDSLGELGLEVLVFQSASSSNNQVFVLIRIPLTKLRETAEADECQLLLDPEVAQREIQLGQPHMGIKPAYIAHRPDITSLLPFEFIYAPYQSKLEHLYAKQQTVQRYNMAHDQHNSIEPNPFSDLVRLKTVAMMLYARSTDNTQCCVNMRSLLNDGHVLACFPLHDTAKVWDLRQRLARYPVQELPLTAIKEYFGEKVAVYFAFAEHLALWLCFPAAVGVPLQLGVYFHGNLSGTNLNLCAIRAVVSHFPSFYYECVC